MFHGLRAHVSRFTRSRFTLDACDMVRLSVALPSSLVWYVSGIVYNLMCCRLMSSDLIPGVGLIYAECSHLRFTCGPLAGYLLLTDYASLRSSYRAMLALLCSDMPSVTCFLTCGGV